MEDALSVALGIDRVEVVASTLTERGVHARRLACHLDVPSSVVVPSPRTVLLRCRTWLEKRQDEIGILSFQPAGDSFHAHHSARSRIYVYRILNRVAPPLLESGVQWHFDRALNVARMEDAARRLQGIHDFGGFVDHRVGGRYSSTAQSTR